MGLSGDLRLPLASWAWFTFERATERGNEGGGEYEALADWWRRRDQEMELEDMFGDEEVGQSDVCMLRLKRFDAGYEDRPNKEARPRGVGCSERRNNTAVKQRVLE